MKSALKMLMFGFFGLLSIGRTQAADALPEITPNGIMTMGGVPQVLFRAVNPGSSAARSYSLAEGDQRDGIKVIAIDQLNGAITFDNHGTIQKIDLQKASLPVYAPASVPKTTPSTASFVSPASVPTSPPEAEPDDLVTLSSTSVRNDEPPAVVVIGSRPSGGGYQHFNGIKPLNNNADNSSDPSHQLIPGRTGLQRPVQTAVTPTASTPPIAGTTLQTGNPSSTPANSPGQGVNAGAANSMAPVAPPANGPPIVPPGLINNPGNPPVTPGNSGSAGASSGWQMSSPRGKSP